VSDQLSLFAVEMRAPALADLQGLLAGPGQAVRRDGAARLSVIVAEQWRVAALLAEFAARDLSGDEGAADGEGVVVGTEFSSRLAPVAAHWLRGAVKQPPTGFVLDAGSLRLWAIAAGVACEGPGYLLRLGPTDESTWSAIGATLAAAGLPATFVGVRADGPGFRITSRRRLARLRELVGDPPPDATDWP